MVRAWGDGTLGQQWLIGLDHMGSFHLITPKTSWQTGPWALPQHTSLMCLVRSKPLWKDVSAQVLHVCDMHGIYTPASHFSRTPLTNSSPPLAGLLMLFVRWTTFVTKGKWVSVLTPLAFDREESLFPTVAASLLERRSRSKAGTQSSGRWGPLATGNQGWLLIYRMRCHQCTKIPR